MSTIAQFCQSLSTLPLSAIIHESLIETRDIAIEQQKDQLFAGIDSEGKRITPGYATSTIARKMRLGQPYDRVTGFYTGSMYAGTFDQIEETTFTLASTSYTFGKFIARYSDKVYGLTVLSLEIVRDATEPVLIEKVKNYLGV